MRNETKSIHFFLMLVIVSILIGCPQKSQTVKTLRSYPMDSLEGVITRSNASLDKENTSDGNGSIHFRIDSPQTIRLFETGDIDVENTRITYQAKLKLENVSGKVYLEMLCHFPGKGEFFSRALQSPLSGDTDWASQETPFFLKKGENPDNIKLNVIIEGAGDIWVDDIKLISLSN